MDVHETHEHIEHAHNRKNRRAAALLIAVLAAMLAITEMAASHRQTAAITANITASDLWNFYQAKTIRAALLRAAVENAALLPAENGARDKQIEAWQGAVARYESDPSTGEGRKELSERAKAMEELRDHELGAYHAFEYGAGALQLAIVMASAAVVTGVFALEIVSGVLGLLGLSFAALGWLAPMLIHF